MKDLNNLEDSLKKGTFNAIEYFLKLEKGAYAASTNIFYDITQHPTIDWHYRVRSAVQQGYEYDNGCDKMTVFKSISQYHLEFMNGVVIVKEDNK